MAKQFYAAITEQHRHMVATLMAAGVRPFSIAPRAGISLHAIERMTKEEGWSELLASKKAVLTKLMGGAQ